MSTYTNLTQQLSSCPCHRDLQVVEKLIVDKVEKINNTVINETQQYLSSINNESDEVREDEYTNRFRKVSSHLEQYQSDLDYVRGMMWH